MIEKSHLRKSSNSAGMILLRGNIAIIDAIHHDSVEHRAGLDSSTRINLYVILRIVRILQINASCNTTHIQISFDVSIVDTSHHNAIQGQCVLHRGIVLQNIAFRDGRRRFIYRSLNFPEFISECTYTVIQHGKICRNDIPLLLGIINILLTASVFQGILCLTLRFLNGIHILLLLRCQTTVCLNILNQIIHAAIGCIIILIVMIYHTVRSICDIRHGSGHVIQSTINTVHGITYLINGIL